MNLFRRSLINVSMAVVCTLFSPAVHASTVKVVPSLHALFGSQKTIQLSLRNDSAATIELRTGDTIMKLEAGKTMSVKLPTGARIITNSDTPKHKAGDLVVEVSSSLSGATIAIS